MSTDAVTWAQQRLRIAQGRLNFAQAGGNPDEIRIATATYRARVADLAEAEAAAAGTPPTNSVDPAVSPAAAQAEAAVEEEVGFFGRLFGSSDTDEDVSEFSEYGSDLATPPPAPQPTPAPEPQEPVDLNLFAEGSDVNDDIPESVILRDPDNVVLTTATDIAEGTARVFAPIDVDDTQTIDEFTTVVVTNDGNLIADEPNDVAGGQVEGVRVENTIPKNVDPDQDATARTVENTAASEDINIQTEAEREQQLLNQQANALLNQARNQATVSAQRKANGTAVGDGDWRVRLRLAPSATYLYKAPDASQGILAPLLATDGIIFPYTPRIDIAYRADYQGYDPTHSNYRHYFYKGSRVEFVTMTANFTAQDTQEANYLLAVIHFLKSASKMFYGQDAERGSPPPLLYLTGLGEYQFNEAPCVIQEFNYNLPDDVDYIRANSQQISGANTLQYQRPLSASTAPSYSLSAVWDRLRGANLPSGATPTVPPPTNLGLGSPTYVPTRLTMTLTLLPIQSRRQVSQEFSLKEYANGNLIRDKGFW